MSERVSIDADKGLSFLQTLAELVLSLFKPVAGAVMKVSQEGQVGFLLIFGIFFSLMLLHLYARARNGAAFADGLRRFGRIGTLGTIGYVGLLAMQALVLPSLVVLVSVLINTVSGGEPNLWQFVRLMTSLAASGFAADFIAFHFTAGGLQVLPLGFQAALIVLAAFGCMWLVGRSLSGTGTPQPQG